MVIKVDEEGLVIIKQLCDIALRKEGLNNLQPVSHILNSIETIAPPQEKKEGKDKK